MIDKLVEPFKAELSFHQLVPDAVNCFLFDNNAVYEICLSTVMLTTPTYHEVVHRCRSHAGRPGQRRKRLTKDKGFLLKVHKQDLMIAGGFYDISSGRSPLASACKLVEQCSHCFLQGAAVGADSRHACFPRPPTASNVCALAFGAMRSLGQYDEASCCAAPRRRRGNAGLGRHCSLRRRGHGPNTSAAA